MIWVSQHAPYVHKPIIKGDKAEVWIEGDEMGPIDSALRMKGPLMQVRGIYKLLLTDTFWKLQVDGINLQREKGALHWRIEDVQANDLHLSVDAAIRYLTDLQDESADPTVKRNAEKTIVALRGYVPKSKN